MAEKTTFKYFETEEELIEHQVKCNARREDVLKSLVHERKHARRARELGYNDIKYGYRVIYDNETRKVIDFRYLIKVEGVTPKDATKIAEAPKNLSNLDKKVGETARIIKALDEIDIPKR